MQDLRRAAENERLLDHLVEQVVPALARASGPSPVELRLLLRCYAAAGNQELGALLETALARAVDDVTASRERPGERPAWLVLFTEAASLSDDPRVVGCAIVLADAITRAWSEGAADVQDHQNIRSNISTAMSAVDACLMAGELDESETDRHLAADAIDELERLIGRWYQPGRGVSAHVGIVPAADALSDHVRSASALLTAHARSGRLPYSMLAEELMQYAMRTFWPVRGQQVQATVDVADSMSDETFVAACHAVGVLSRMASLHADADYRAAAVIAQACDYEGEAGLLIDTLGRLLDDRDAESTAEYGLALFDWLSLP